MYVVFNPWTPLAILSAKMTGSGRDNGRIRIAGILFQTFFRKLLDLREAERSVPEPGPLAFLMASAPHAPLTPAGVRLKLREACQGNAGRKFERVADIPKRG